MPDFHLENASENIVCGFDEVGRAPLAGPVVAACVFVPKEKYELPLWREVNDSKLVPAEKREALSLEIKTHAIWAIAEASVEEVENLNIVQASFLAMRRAFDITMSSLRKQGSGKLNQPDSRFGRNDVLALVDGNLAPKLPCPVHAIVKGDQKSVSIAAASIIAKVYRDDLMSKLAEIHPHYGWERNAGYPTPEHLASIGRHGITAHHRKTFAPIRNFIEFGHIKRQLRFAV